MRFKVGDKVSFLNENGGGTITALIDQRLVKIETDDGFEMPVLSSELILDHRYLQSEEQTFLPSPPPLPVAEPEPETEPELVSEINPWGNIKEEKGIYLAFEPHEPRWVLTGDMDVFLINHTSCEMLYSLFLERNGHLEGVDYGSVPPGSKTVIDTIGRDEIENWTKGYVQALLHEDRPARIYLPVHANINIRASSFLKEGSYHPNTLLQNKALIVTVSTLAALQSTTGTEQDGKNDPQLNSGKAETVREKPLIDKHRTNIGTAVVDLHIGELLDNIAGLSSHDMFNIQMAYFRKTLESAILNEYHKVTYIHGVGNGVLKNALVKEIEEYEGLENSMASISKFGVGAIDILIKPRE